MVIYLYIDNIFYLSALSIYKGQKKGALSAPFYNTNMRRYSFIQFVDNAAGESP